MPKHDLIEDVVELATWALQMQDLRHRILYAPSAAEIGTTHGVADVYEQVVVQAIVEAALMKGYHFGQTVDWERQYPGTAKGNPQRADLAFKEPGKGKNWAFVEVKAYSSAGVDDDLEKLRAIDNRVQRWLLVYHIRPAEGKSWTIEKLLQDVPLYKGTSARCREFPTVTKDGEAGVCQVWLGRI